MSTDTPDMAEYRTIHARDISEYEAGLEDLRATLASALDGIESIARTLANAVPVAEEGQRNLRIQGDSISEYARHRGEAGVTTPDLLAAFLDSLTGPQRRVYAAARGGPSYAALALGRTVRAATDPT